MSPRTESQGSCDRFAARTEQKRHPNSPRTGGRVLPVVAIFTRSPHAVFVTVHDGRTDVPSPHPKLVSWWWLGLEGGVPPPVGAFTGRPLTGGDRWWGLCGWSGQRRVGQVLAVGVGDDELVRGPGEGDAPGVVQPVVVRADEDEVGDKSLIRPSPVGSFGLKGFHREPTVFWCCGPGYGVCSGSVNRL